MIVTFLPAAVIVTNTLADITFPANRDPYARTAYYDNLPPPPPYRDPDPWPRLRYGADQSRHRRAAFALAGALVWAKPRRATPPAPARARARQAPARPIAALPRRPPGGWVARARSRRHRRANAHGH